MPTLFKPLTPRKIPKDTEIVQRDGVPHCKIIEKGRAVYYPLTANGKAYLKPGPKWASNVQMANGSRKRVTFSTRQDVSQKMLSDLLTRIELEKAGIVDKYTDHRQTLLATHLADWKAALLASGVSAEYADMKTKRAERLLDDSRCTSLADVQASKVHGQLAEYRQNGLSIQTSNFYLQSLKQFFNWMMKDQRTNENPIQHL